MPSKLGATEYGCRYYNTVGSKEGWIPSAFVSSRELRQKDKQAASSQRPEDFMDEEDLQDAADKENLQTRESFAGLGEESSISAKSLSVDLLSMSSEKIGARLLQRMGWREGQGIGPKILRKARLRDDADDIDDHDDVHYFAPKDTKLISFNRKDNSKGLGFTEGDASLQKMATLSSDVPLKDNELDMFNLPVRKREGKAAKKRGGIGIGILNDTGSDEEDPYEIGPRISYSRTTVPTSNKNKSKQTKSQVSSANPLLTTKPFFQSKKNTVVSKSSSRRRCHDGLPPLPGFYLAELLEVQSLASKYPFPQVPPHWTTSRTSSTDKKFPTHVPKMSSLSAKSGMNPSARAATLGEAMLPGKSVFDFVSSVNRNRIADATNNVNLPSGLGQKISDSGNIHEKWKGENVKTDIPYLEKDVALGALHRSMLRGMPYADDAEKLKRYRSFLRYSAGLLKDLQSSQPELPHDQKVIEYQEFTQTARVFQPISSTMATRFTSSSTEPNTSTVKNEGVSDKASVDFPDVKSSAEAAAKAGMYGQLTRSVHAFHPTPLVCKRFGVPQPLPSQDDDNVQGSTDKSNLAGIGRISCQICPLLLVNPRTSGVWVKMLQKQKCTLDMIDMSLKQTHLRADWTLKEMMH